MSRRLEALNKIHLTAADPMAWTPWTTIPGGYEITSIQVKFATSPTTSELLTVSYKPPTDKDSVAGVETVLLSYDPSTGANDTEKQNVVFNLNRRFAEGGVLYLKYTNTDNIATISSSIEFDDNPSM